MPVPVLNPKRRMAALQGHLHVDAVQAAATAARDAPPAVPATAGGDEHCGEALAAGLTPSQLAHYHEFGFVVLRSLYEGAEVDALRAEFEHLLAHRPAERGSEVDEHGLPVPGSASHYNFTDPVRGDDPRTFNATKVVLNRVNDPLTFAPAIRTAYGSPRLLACATSLYGPDVVPLGQSLVLKPPHYGAGFSFHQVRRRVSLCPQLSRGRSSVTSGARGFGCAGHRHQR